MEGTRHEKAALVSVAYFIGALTAFIGYGIANNNALPLESTVNTSQTASVITAVSRGAEAQKETNIINYEDGVLSIEAIDGTRVLSFNPAVSDFEDNGEFTEQGSHFGNLIFSAATSNEYVFFCEQKTADGSTCNPFVYDVLVDAIYPLSVMGESVSLTTNAAKSVVWKGNKLVVDGMMSAEATTPWKLVK